MWRLVEIAIPNGLLSYTLETTGGKYSFWGLEPPNAFSNRILAFFSFQRQFLLFLLRNWCCSIFHLKSVHFQSKLRGTKICHSKKPKLIEKCENIKLTRKWNNCSTQAQKINTWAWTTFIKNLFLSFMMVMMQLNWSERKFNVSLTSINFWRVGGAWFFWIFCSCMGRNA